MLVLLQVAEAFKDFATEASGQTADLRVMKKRLDQFKHEVKVTEDRLSDARRMVISLATEIEMIQVEAGHIKKRLASTPDSPDLASADRILALAGKVAVAATKMATGLKAPPKQT
jgi:regulator of replication initiation timing